MKLSIGKPAPDFTLTNQESATVRLSDYRGKKVILYFYPKDFTSGCTKQACNLRDNYASLQNRGYEVLGVSADTESRHKAFIEKEKLPFQLLADVDKKIHQLYGTWVEKSMYGRSYMGTKRTTFIIDEKGIITDIITKVNTKDHTSQIL